MKIAFTIVSFDALVNVGADAERMTYVVNIPDQQIPLPVLNHLEGGKETAHQTLSISTVYEL